MTAVLALLATVALAAGASVLYLATRHQAVLVRPLPGAAARPAGLASLAAALAIFQMLMGPATAVFAWMTGLMLLWTVPPVVVAWIARKRP